MYKLLYGITLIFVKEESKNCWVNYFKALMHEMVTKYMWSGTTLIDCIVQT